MSRVIFDRLLTFGLMAAMPEIGFAQDTSTMTGMPMQEHSAPTSPSALSASASMQNMDMQDDASRGMVLIDQLEYAHGHGGNGPMWDAEAWYGNDENKLWLRSEGEGSQGRIESGDIEALWNHPISAFWSTQLGTRHDLGVGTPRNWVAIGVEGLAPYWVELEATAYIRASGQVAARARAEYTLRFTQRWQLQPEFEINLYNRDDPRDRLEGDLDNAQLGLRLRYQVTRQFAPYAGLVWKHRLGASPPWTHDEREPDFDRQFVVGIHLWL